ncbi:hypothetical protein AVEN_6239-1 [Araneus ventricosus]|uniref:Uncharacterized protein n=1 Tax=Araneus ventricosus TaxID=182803 RepID=A0A4Y2GLT6_ARAVE|nr:hypothetical protein AVEN_6239-1 [Araneus ventricosus]
MAAAAHPSRRRRSVIGVDVTQPQTIIVRPNRSENPLTSPAAYQSFNGGSPSWGGITLIGIFRYKAQNRNRLLYVLYRKLWTRKTVNSIDTGPSHTSLQAKDDSRPNVTEISAPFVKCD